jgi:NAD-dependent SIR2 family protein deacetylase
MDALVALLRGRRVVALTGAGCSTESGIPDYRGTGAPPRGRPSIQHRELVEQPAARRRYWARSLLGWPRLASARPNRGHEALAALERAGAVAGIITQNVDGLHHAAGSVAAVELHGALRRVRCLSCGDLTARDALQARLEAANPGFAARAAATAPDGDADLDDATAAALRPVDCTRCGGVLVPDVVFFGGSVPRETLDAAWAAFGRAEVLLVVGTSLTVFSGYRFVRRAAERAVPVAIVNHGPTRGDPHAALRIDAPAGATLSALADHLR